MDNLRVVTLDEIPAVLRWIDLSHRAGHLTGDNPTDADFDFFTVYGNNTNAFASATLVGYTVTPEEDATASPYTD